MNKSIIMIFFSALISKNALSQTTNYKIIYKQCIQLDTARVLFDTLGAVATLVGNSKCSNYSFYKRALNTNITNTEKLMTAEEAINQKKSGKFLVTMDIFPDSIGNIVYHNKKNDSIYVREKMTNEYVITEEKAPIINWTITDDTRMIKNYKCYKATMHFRGRDYTAWFTTDIPIIDAPWKFNGLPGLVMDIYDAKNQVKIYVESIEYPTKSTVSPFHPLGTRISLNEYFTFRNNEMIKKMKSFQAMLNSQEGLDMTSFKPKARMGSVLYGIEISNN